MFYTYVLKCTNSKQNHRKFYVGYSKNISNRVIDHLSKSTQITKSFDKIELVYYEACPNKTDAIVREKQLKTGFGRGYIKRRLKNYLKNM